jgi:hypothetical protein
MYTDLSSSRTINALPELAPWRCAARLPRLPRAGPSASLDKSVSPIQLCPIVAYNRILVKHEIDRFG